MFNPFRKSGRKQEIPREKPAAAKKAAPVRRAPTSAHVAPTSGSRRFLGILISPHRTEKASGAAASGWYAFSISPTANKIAVRKAVEERYGVRVLRVNIISSRRRTVRLGRITGTVLGVRKAMVKLHEGQALDLT